jgi:hypothetical protein
MLYCSVRNCCGCDLGLGTEQFRPRDACSEFGFTANTDRSCIISISRTLSTYVIGLEKCVDEVNRTGGAAAEKVKTSECLRKRGD